MHIILITIVSPLLSKHEIFIVVYNSYIYIHMQKVHLYYTIITHFFDVIQFTKKKKL